MDEAQFVVTEPKAWWMVDPEVPYEINNSRLQLGEAFGWRDPQWYTYENNLRDVYQELQSHHPDLLYRLDNTMESPSEQLQWLESLMAALAGKNAEAAAATEVPVEPGPPPSASEPAGGASAGEAAGTWDESWGMLYRLGPSGAYEFAHSDDQRTVRPGTDWMSQEEVTASRGGGAGGEVTETTGVEIPPAVEQVMSQMASDPAAMAARLGISEEQAAQLATDPEFQAMVAAAFEGASS